MDSSKFECNAFKVKPRKKWSSITPDHINTYQYNNYSFLSNIDIRYGCIHCINLLCTKIIQTNLIQILHNNN